MTPEHYAAARRALAEAHLTVVEAEQALGAAQSVRYRAVEACGHHTTSPPYTVVVGGKAVTVTPTGTRRGAEFKVTQVVA